MLVTIERWQGGVREEEKELPPTRSAVCAAIGEMSAEWSATLSIEIGTRELLIASSEGRFIVTAIVGELDIFDRVGDHSVAGDECFLIGGVGTDTPRRHVVTEDAAVSAAIEFLENGTISPTAGWENQYLQ